jgi:hypothetical protein
LEPEQVPLLLRQLSVAALTEFRARSITLDGVDIATFITLLGPVQNGALLNWQQDLVDHVARSLVIND